MTYFKKLSLLTTALLFISMLFISCSETEADSSSSEPYIVDLTAREFSFELPSKIKSGWVTFRFKNEGSLTHVAQILKLENNLSSVEVDSILNSGEYPATSEVMGGPGLHTGGESSEITVHLDPGIYIMLCGTRMKNDVAHFDLGMVSRLEVTEEVGAEHPPQADMSLTLEDYQIKMEGDLSAGKNTFKIDGNNTAYDVHLVALEGPSTEQAAYEYFSDLQDPTPVKLHGGVEEGHISYYAVDIAPGEYLLSSHEYGKWGMHNRVSLSKNGELAVEEKETQQQVQIKTADYDIMVPEDISGGRTQITIHNEGSKEHQLEIWNLQDGKGAEDWVHWMTSNKKDHMEGHHNHTAEFPGKGYGITFESVDPQQVDTLTIDLVPGNYVAVCYTENEDGKYHIEEGEIKTFEVK